HRIRWGNVARAAALAAAVALLIAWPKLRADPPPLPKEPVVQAAEPPAAEFAPEGGERVAEEEPERRAPGEANDRSKSRRRRERSALRVRRQRREVRRRAAAPSAPPAP